MMLQAAEGSPKEVLALWRQLPALAKSTPKEAYRKLDTWLPNRGVRGLYAKAVSYTHLTLPTTPYV